MLIKHGDVEIIDVIKDNEHAIDDDGTKKAMDKLRAENLEQKQDLNKKDN